MGDPPTTRREACRDAKLQELQARAVEPLIELIAESLTKGDEASEALLSWLESLDGSAALRDLQRRILDAYVRHLRPRQPTVSD